jgi:pyrimidine-nucleoside phosphorylase
MYALRDVTGTIESIPLIAGSIMSKKLAEGLDALVLDVKTGDGAFMESEEDALALARALVGIGTAAGKTTIAFLTAMDRPLGLAIGNWCEVVESIECLRGRNVADLMEVTYVLGGAMVMLGGKAGTIAEGMALCRSAIWSGRAYEKFLESVRRQGGDTQMVENPGAYPAAAHTREVISTRDGYVSGFDTRRVGVLAVELGAGRQRAGDAIDHKAGIVLRKKTGDRVAEGEVLAVVSGDRKECVESVHAKLGVCIHIGAEIPPRRPAVKMVVDRIGDRPWVQPELV